MAENMLWFVLVESRHARVKQKFHVRIEQYIEREAMLLRLLLDLAEEGRRLLPAIKSFL